MLVRLLGVIFGLFAASGATDFFAGSSGWALPTMVAVVSLAGGLVYASVVTVGDQLIARPARP